MKLQVGATKSTWSLFREHPVGVNLSSVIIMSWRLDFVEFCLRWEVLRFGEFELKSGRRSPYFFNAGLFSSGGALRELGIFYAKAIEEAVVSGKLPKTLRDGPASSSSSGASTALKEGADRLSDLLSPDVVLFGPAYKGIPLSVATGIALSGTFGVEVGCTFNRKVAKDHGEGGLMVGAALRGKRVLLVDDVITAGTAIRESVGMLKNVEGGCTIAGVLIAMDRQEIPPGDTDKENQLSAIQQVEREFGFPVVSIITLDDLVVFMESDKYQKENKEKILSDMKQYRTIYGVKK